MADNKRKRAFPESAKLLYLYKLVELPPPLRGERGGRKFFRLSKIFRKIICVVINFEIISRRVRFPERELANFGPRSLRRNTGQVNAARGGRLRNFLIPPAERSARSSFSLGTRGKQSPENAKINFISERNGFQIKMFRGERSRIPHSPATALASNFRSESPLAESRIARNLLMVSCPLSDRSRRRRRRRWRYEGKRRRGREGATGSHPRGRGAEEGEAQEDGGGAGKNEAGDTGQGR